MPSSYSRHPPPRHRWYRWHIAFQSAERRRYRFRHFLPLQLISSFIFHILSCHASDIMYGALSCRVSSRFFWPNDFFRIFDMIRDYFRFSQLFFPSSLEGLFLRPLSLYRLFSLLISFQHAYFARGRSTHLPLPPWPPSRLPPPCTEITSHTVWGPWNERMG